MDGAYLIAVAAQEGARKQVAAAAVVFETVGANEPDGSVLLVVFIRRANGLALAAVDAVECVAELVVLKDLGNPVIIQKHRDFNRGLGGLFPVLVDVLADFQERRIQQLQILRQEFLVLVKRAEVKDQLKVGSLDDELADVKKDIDVGDGVEAVLAFPVVEGECAGFRDAEVGLCEEDIGCLPAVLHIGDRHFADAAAVETVGDGGQVEADFGTVFPWKEVVHHLHEVVLCGGPIDLKVLGLQSFLEGDELRFHILDIAVACSKSAGLDVVDAEIC